jgi:hypothetical protein
MPHLGVLAPSVVRINVHGSKDRVKDASPRRGDDCSSPWRGAYVLLTEADDVPLLGVLRTSAVIGAPLRRLETHEAGGPI